MFNFKGIFKSKKAEDNQEAAEEDSEEEQVLDKELKKSASVKAEAGDDSNRDLVKVTTEIDRLKASVESFGEIRKGLTERISAISEQIGELRAMILDRDRTIQEIEIKSVKAADLVESVQPDKLMVGLQREDAKFEALKANLEGNEAIMERIMEELKEMRKKLDFFRGVNEIVKLAEEVRKELIEIKKVEASIHVDTDKVDTIYSELRKKFQEIDSFSDNLRELRANLEQNAKDVDSIKNKMSGLANKEELDKLVKRVQRYVDVLHEIDKSSSLSKDVSQLKSLLEGLG